MNNFIRATLIRAIRTVCQTAVAVIGTAFVLTDVNWWMVLSASLLAGILSVLTSIATGLPEVDEIDDEEFYDNDWDEDNGEDDDED